MSTGIKAWDISGNLILDYTDRISKVFQTGFLVFSASNQTVNINVLGISDNDQWAVLIPNGHYIRIFDGYFSAISSSSWTEPNAAVPYTVIKR